MGLNVPPLPFDSSLEQRAPDPQTGQDKSTGYISDDWQNWLNTLVSRVNQSPQRMVSVRLVAQTGALALTPLPMPALSAGLYRVTYYARVQQSATVSSSLAITLRWTDGTAPCSKAFAAIVNNDITLPDSQSWEMRIDQNAPIEYSTAFASIGATPMTYNLDFTVELIGL